MTFSGGRAQTAAGCQTSAFLAAATPNRRVFTGAAADAQEAASARPPKLCEDSKKNQKKKEASSCARKTTELICDIESDMKRPAGGQRRHPRGTASREKIMRISNSPRSIIEGSERKETRFNFLLVVVAVGEEGDH